MENHGSATRDSERELDDVDLAILSGQQHAADQMILNQMGVEPVTATQGKRPKGRPKGRNFRPKSHTFDDDSLDKLDELASAAGMGKSAYLRHLIVEAHDAREGHTTHSAKLDKILNLLGDNR